MAVGRISGPLLKDNLLRNGVNLAFETNLLYLDVVNRRVGINNGLPTNDLSVNGTTRTTNLEVTSSAKLGNITFSSNTISSSNSTINLTPQGAKPVVYQGQLNVGQLILSGNTIASSGTNTNIEITPTGSGITEFNSNVTVNGNLHATGNITADGNITLGNAPTDTVTFDAEIASDIIPQTTNTYNIGRATGPVLTLGAFTGGTGYTSGVAATSGTGTGLTLNVTAILNTYGVSAFNNVSGTPIGTGFTFIDVTQSSTSGTGTGLAINVSTGSTPSASYTSAMVSIYAAGNGYAIGDTVTFPGTLLDGTSPTNDLTLTVTTVLNGIITGVSIATPGTGYSPGDQVSIVGGTGGTVTVGTVGSLYWNNLYAGTVNATTANVGTITTTDLQTSGLDISNSTISAKSANTDISFATTGTGGVVFGNLKFTSNAITNISPNAVTQLAESGTGYVKIAGTNGVVIPSGTVANRPATQYTETGMIRFNTDLQYVEIYNGSIWTSVAGTAGGVSANTATDISIGLVLALG